MSTFASPFLVCNFLNPFIFYITLRVDQLEGFACSGLFVCFFSPLTFLKLFSSHKVLSRDQQTTVSPQHFADISKSSEFKCEQYQQHHLLARILSP